MSKVVSLRRVRKQRGRDEARQAGDAAAARGSVAEAERARARGEAARAARALEAHRRDDPET